MVQFLFTTLTSLFNQKCNRLKARVVIYAYNHHVRLLSPEPLVVTQPKFTRVKEPTLLCNQVELPLKAGPRITRDGTPRGLKLGSRDVPKKLVLTRNLLAIRMLRLAA